MILKEKLIPVPSFCEVPFFPVANKDAMVIADGARFTVLTDRLIRMEYSATSSFEDRPSQVFWFREQPVPRFELRVNDSAAKNEPEYLLLVNEKGHGGFSAESLKVTLKENGTVWCFGQRREILRSNYSSPDENAGNCEGVRSKHCG